ncbi:MAG: hypothetical protein U0905_05615 [Pirellulales bacterium]
MRTLFCALILWLGCTSLTQADSIWEYDPYKVQLWISIDPGMAVSRETTDELIREFRMQVENSFGGTIDLHVESTPPAMRAKIYSDLARIEIQDLQVDDLLLVIAKSQATSIRSAQAAFEKLTQIKVLAGMHRQVQEELQKHAEDSDLQGVAGKLEAYSGDLKGLIEDFKSGVVTAALVNRDQADSMKEWVRQIGVRFPWQMDSIIRNHDKLMLANLRRSGEFYSFQIREFDCSMRYMGPLWVREGDTWNVLSRTMMFGFRDAFTPMARIEQADAKVAELTVRAGGLIASDDHPAMIRPGDVVMPMVRRSERAGAEATLQSIPWTYIAMTHGDRVHMKGSVYSGVRGALQGRQNKRIQRLALIVKTPVASTQLKLTAMTSPSDKVGSGKPVPGIAVYQRVPSQENLEFLGRSDWRGIIPLPNSPLPEIEYEIRLAPAVTSESGSPAPGEKTEAPVAESAATDSASSSDKDNAATSASQETKPAETTSTAAASTPKPPAVEKKKVQLNVPLYLYYVKNGDTVLARLPVVHGMQSLEVAELPDDSRRLEAEALLRGLQGEIVDIVAKRKILEMRLDKRIKEDKLEEAKVLLEDLKSVPSYEDINERLNSIQQQVLRTDKGPVPAGVKGRIDVMIDATRQMMQKYLQINLAREYEAKLAPK